MQKFFEIWSCYFDKICMWRRKGSVSTSQKASGYFMAVLNAYALQILLHAGEGLRPRPLLSSKGFVLHKGERPLYLQIRNPIHLKSKSRIGKEREVGWVTVKNSGKTHIWKEIQIYIWKELESQYCPHHIDLSSLIMYVMGLLTSLIKRTGQTIVVLALTFYNLLSQILQLDTNITFFDLCYCREKTHLYLVSSHMLCTYS